MGSKSRSKYSKKRKFKGNRFEKRKSDEKPCASQISMTSSESKLNNSSSTIIDLPNDVSFIINMDCLNSILKEAACKVCFQCCLKIKDNPFQRQGCSLLLNLECSNCSFIGEKQSTSKRTKQSFDVNRRLVYGMREIGCGYSDAFHFLTVMNLPPPPLPKAYNDHVKSLVEVVKPLAEEIMIKAADNIRKIKENDECGVSVDGSWQKRGYSSLSGIVSTLSVDTGEVIDTEILSKDCFGCRKWKNKDKSSCQYLLWKTSHVCSINHSGTSNNMESIGACRIFERSIAKRGLKYTEYYGDGDSKSFDSVVKYDPYQGTTIYKKECIGHYQKRLGTALRTCKKKTKGIGGKGKLTDIKIDKMQNYFGIALRSNTESVESMYHAIWASFYHIGATDDHPLHSKCPTGIDSWCSYQRAKTKCVHYKHKDGLPLSVMSKIKPIYERLTARHMLEKCLHGKTQNANESFHSMVWQRCPKTTYTGLDTLNLAVYDAIIHFNGGAAFELEIMKRMNINPGFYMSLGVKKKDNLRLRESKRHSTSSFKQQTYQR